MKKTKKLIIMSCCVLLLLVSCFPHLALSATLSDVPTQYGNINVDSNKCVKIKLKDCRASSSFSIDEGSAFKQIADNFIFNKIDKVGIAELVKETKAKKLDKIYMPEEYLKKYTNKKLYNEAVDDLRAAVDAGEKWADACEETFFTEMNGCLRLLPTSWECSSDSKKKGTHYRYVLLVDGDNTEVEKKKNTVTITGTLQVLESSYKIKKGKQQKPHSMTLSQYPVSISFDYDKNSEDANIRSHY